MNRYKSIFMGMKDLCPLPKINLWRANEPRIRWSVTATGRESGPADAILNGYYFRGYMCNDGTWAGWVCTIEDRSRMVNNERLSTHELETYFCFDRGHKTIEDLEYEMGRWIQNKPIKRS